MAIQENTDWEEIHDQTFRFAKGWVGVVQNRLRTQYTSESCPAHSLWQLGKIKNPSEDSHTRLATTIYPGWQFQYYNKQEQKTSFTTMEDSGSRGTFWWRKHALSTWNGNKNFAKQYKDLDHLTGCKSAELLLSGHIYCLRIRGVTQHLFPGKVTWSPYPLNRVTPEAPWLSQWRFLFWSGWRKQICRDWWWNL